MATSGRKLRLIGKFHGTITPTTPKGCGITRLEARPKILRSTARFCGCIQRPRCLSVTWMSLITGISSISIVSWRERWP